MAQYSGINVVLYRWQRDLRTLKSKCLAVVAASKQCTDEVLRVPFFKNRADDCLASILEDFSTLEVFVI